MTMRLRQLQIRLQTTDGRYGTTLDFPDGLLVIWADNTTGKSTCMKALLVALGMEAMLTTSQSNLPLPPAVTTLLDSGSDRYEVIESEIFLEIENAHGSRITLQRMVRSSHESRHSNLITVYEGPILTEPASVVRSQDYFVSRPGSATRESGFHNYLTQFLGWEPPVVQNYDGNSYPLYLQCIFPFFLVEQSKGWSSILPPVPTQFRIRDVYKRSIEFLLDLSAHKIALRRQELATEKSNLEFEWQSRYTAAQSLAQSVCGVIQGLADKPQSIWPPQVEVQVSVSYGEELISLERSILAKEAELKELTQIGIPRAQDVVSTSEKALAESEYNVNHNEVLLMRILDAFELEQQELTSVKQRLQVLNEDIQRNKDAQTLRKLGSRKASEVDRGSCPVCHQSIQDSLIPLAGEQNFMSLDDNISFLIEQKRTFEAVLVNSERITRAREVQVNQLRNELERDRAKVRGLRQTLVSDGRAPSIAAIRNQIEIENRIRIERQTLEQLQLNFDGFEALSNSWNRIEKELSDLPKADLSIEDSEKLILWTALLREQLNQYGFSSHPSAEITISRDTYRPEHEGFDLQTSISASDLIRTKWSYLHGILELARLKKTNHPGCLVFDEPRQQSTRVVSFGQLLQRASTAGKTGQQVVLFTSENRDTLQKELSGLPHTFVPIEGHFLRKQ